jgi:hypothetical protein
MLLPGFLFFTLNRFDILPALLTALSLACLGRRWHTASAIALAAAVLVKVYPVLLAPLILRYLWPDRAARMRWTMVFTLSGSLAFVPLLFGADLEAVLAPYRYQLTRPPELGFTIYGCLLPVQLGTGLLGAIFRLTVFGTAMTALIWWPIKDMTSLLRRGTLLLLAFVSLAVFYSPQWIVWFAPLLFPLAARERRIGNSFAALDAITYLTFPVWFWIVPEIGMQILRLLMPLDEAGWWNNQIAMLIGSFLRVGRFVACAILTWQMIHAEWPHLLPGSWVARRLPRVTWFLTQKI